MSGSCLNENKKTGFLVKAPRPGKTGRGVDVCNLRILVVRYYKVKGDDEWHKTIEGYFDVAKFGGNAGELCQTLGKGDFVEVLGRDRQRRRELKNKDQSPVRWANGSPVTVDETFIAASSIVLLRKKGSGASGGQAGQQAAAPAAQQAAPASTPPASGSAPADQGPAPSAAAEEQSVEPQAEAPAEEPQVEAPAAEPQVEEPQAAAPAAEQSQVEEPQAEAPAAAEPQDEVPPAGADESTAPASTPPADGGEPAESQADAPGQQQSTGPEPDAAPAAGEQSQVGGPPAGQPPQAEGSEPEAEADAVASQFDDAHIPATRKARELAVELKVDLRTVNPTGRKKIGDDRRQATQQDVKAKAVDNERAAGEGTAPAAEPGVGGPAAEEPQAEAPGGEQSQVEEPQAEAPAAEQSQVEETEVEEPFGGDLFPESDEELLEALEEAGDFDLPGGDADFGAEPEVEPRS